MVCSRTEHSTVSACYFDLIPSRLYVVDIVQIYLGCDFLNLPQQHQAYRGFPQTSKPQESDLRRHQRPGLLSRS